MPSTRKTLDNLAEQDETLACFHDYLVRRGVVPHSGKWSSDAAVGCFLDGLVQDISSASAMIRTNDNGSAALGSTCGRLDDLIGMSDQMRGMIFSEYSRKILNLMLARQGTGPAEPWPVMSGWLN